MGLTNMSDLFAATMETFTTKLNQDSSWTPLQSALQDQKPNPRRWSSVIEGDLANKMDAVMQEFRMNGLDSPYDPVDMNVGSTFQNPGFLGLSPPSNYLRQKSWPAPESSPAARLPQYNPMEFTHSSSDEDSIASMEQSLSEHQRRVLSTIPTDVLHHLLRELDGARALEKPQKTYKSTGRKQEVECRFCKNNGERAQWYRSHPLRARGRVACPVLRALVCRQCGASADRAHTLKYCPLTTPLQRMKSAAMMQSLRVGKRRARADADYVVFGELSRDLVRDAAAADAPLDPVWAALERKLMH